MQSTQQQPFDYRSIAPGGVVPLACGVTCDLCKQKVPYGDDFVYKFKDEEDFDVCEPCFQGFVTAPEASKFTKMSTMVRCQPLADRLFGSMLVSIYLPSEIGEVDVRTGEDTEME